MNHRAKRIFIVVFILTAAFTFILLLTADLPNPGLVESYRYYVVKGNNASDLRKEMHDLGPVNNVGRRCDAYTEWQVTWAYPYSRSRDGCTTGPVKTTVKVTYHFPQWEGSTGGPPDEWNRFLTALKEHEDGHRDIAIRAARKIAEALSSLPAQPSCERIEEAADSVGNRLLENARSEERLYDEETDHGATQGVRLR